MNTEIYLYIYLLLHFYSYILILQNVRVEEEGYSIIFILYLTAQMKEISTYKAFFPAHETETITIS